MKFQGIIAEVGEPHSGINKQTGKEWVCRTLSILIPYYNERGEERNDNIVADYFGDMTDAELRDCIDYKVKLNFIVVFSTRKYEKRRYQSARVYSITRNV